MSFTDSTLSTDQSSTSVCRDVGSFLVPRDPSITDPWMRPRPTHGTNLLSLFDNSVESEEHLKVYLRIKPTKKKPSDCYQVKTDKSFITTHPDSRKIQGGKNCIVQKLYNFSHIFNDTNNSQEDVFDRVIRDNLTEFIAGKNFTILTYGASGSGKTYSLMGTEDNPGIIPRFLEALFLAIEVDRLPAFKPNNKNLLDPLKLNDKENEIQEIQWIMKNFGSLINPQYTLNTYNRMSVCIQNDSQRWSALKNIKNKYEVWVSFAEIYNDAIFDLLRNDSSLPNQPPTKLRLIQTSNTPYIQGLKWVYVRNGAEAFAALERGRSRLRYAQTNINSRSSRSHCLFTLKLVQYNSDLSESSINIFRLCDLAGSERAKKTGNEGVRLNESRKINTSLHVLERCLASIRHQQEGQQSMPPYRESKLTSLLQNALAGYEAIAMLVTINPDVSFFDETQHVLQFSSVAKEIKSYSYENPKYMKKSKSCIDIKTPIREQSFDTSTDADLNEIEYLQNELERMQIEYEKKIQQREREVRFELVTKFENMLKEKGERSEEAQEKQRKRLNELHQWEKDNLKKQHEMDIEALHAEYENDIEIMKGRINIKSCKDAETQTYENDLCDIIIIKEEPMNHTQDESSSDHNMNQDNEDIDILQTTNGNVTLNGITPLNDSIVDEINTIDSIDVNPLPCNGKVMFEDFKILSIIPDIIPIETILNNNKPTEIDAANISPAKNIECDEKKDMFNKFYTEKKEKPSYLQELGACTVGNSRRKLFTRREFDEMAAETKVPPESTRCLNFEEDSPGAIVPPKLDKPYKMALRKKKNK